MVKKILKKMRGKEKIDVYINQNVLVLIIGLVGIFVSKEYAIPELLLPSRILTFLMLISVLICMFAYTIHYWRKKLE